MYFLGCETKFFEKKNFIGVSATKSWKSQEFSGLEDNLSKGEKPQGGERKAPPSPIDQRVNREPLWKTVHLFMIALDIEGHNTL